MRKFFSAILAILLLTGTGFGASRAFAAEKGDYMQEFLSGYEPLLNKLCLAVMEPDDPDHSIGGVTGVSEAARMYPSKREAARHVGYLLEDVSGDAVPELIVVTSGDGKIASNIVAVYTLVTGEPTCCLEGWARNRYGYLGNGKFYNEGSGGAWNSIFGVFALDRSALDVVCEEFYFTEPVNANPDDIAVFYNKTGQIDKNASTRLSISMDELWERAKKWEDSCQQLKFIPFTNFAAG